MARVPVDATAFAHRTSPIMVNVVAIFERPDEGEVHGPWVDGFAGASISATTERTSTSSATRARSGPRGVPGRHVGSPAADQGTLRPDEPVPSQPEHPAGRRMNDRALGESTGSRH